MKKFNFFGYKVEVKRDKKEITSEISSEEYLIKSRIIYYLLIIFLIVLSAKVPYLYRSNNYTRGDIVREDIYAPKTIIYRDKEAKEKIIEDMIANSEKKYIYSSDTEEIYTSALNRFFEDILLMKENKIKAFDYSFLEKTTGKRVSENLVRSILSLSESEILKMKERVSSNISEIYLEGVYKESNFIRYPKIYNDIISDIGEIEKEIMDTFISPNYIYDIDRTRTFIEGKVSQVKDQYIEIKAGTLVAKTGETLTDRKIDILNKLEIYTYKNSIIAIIFNLAYILLISALLYTVGINFYMNDFANKKTYNAILLITVSVFLVFRFTPTSMIYVIPLDTVLFLLLFITRTRFSSYVFLCIIGYLLPLVEFDMIYFFTYATSLVMAGYLLKKVTTRSGIIAVGIELSVQRMLFYFLFNFFSNNEGFGVAFILSQILISGLISGMLTIAILPYFEKTFNILTIFRLIELGDLSHPLLRKLSIEAPGTFQHSMMVAILSENAVVELGGNSVFARVACYYHDIGKCKRPKFFIENQGPLDENPHNNVSPFMSKMIITSHTKDGSEMAKEYQIPKEIRDIMFEHQGTTLLAYFYNKAKEIDDTILEDEFRYSGPKPQSKESAVIMLADSIEAAVRSMDIKNPILIEQMIRKIINAKIKDNQLSDANITFKEIETIIASFVKTFGAIYHERIKYPGQ